MLNPVNCADGSLNFWHLVLFLSQKNAIADGFSLFIQIPIHFFLNFQNGLFVCFIFTKVDCLGDSIRS